MSKRKDKPKHKTDTLTPAQRETIATAKAAHDVLLPHNKTEPKLKSNKADASKVKPKKAATKSKQTKKSTVKAKKKPVKKVSMSEAVKAAGKKKPAPPAVKSAKKIVSKKKPPAKHKLKADPFQDKTAAYHVTFCHNDEWYDGGEYADLPSASKRFTRLRRNLYKEDYVNLLDIETHAAYNSHGVLDTNETVVEDLSPGEAVIFPDAKQKYDKYKGGGKNLPDVIRAEFTDYSKAVAEDSGPEYKDNSTEYSD